MEPKTPNSDGTCKLCGRFEGLVRSHIVPEFLHQDLYDEKHRAATIRPTGGRSGIIQKGLRERLLCLGCEKTLNDEYEKPFLAQWRDGHLRPKRLRPHEYHLVHGLDYAKTKLLLLSILWRASVATIPEFSGVTLGPHEEMIREMLLRGRPGPASRYPIVGVFAVSEEGRPIPFVSSPIPYRIFGHRAYVFGIDGCEWTFFVTSHRLPDVEEICLQENGPTLFGASLLKDLRTAKATRRRAAR